MELGFKQLTERKTIEQQLGFWKTLGMVLLGFFIIKGLWYFVTLPL